MKHNWEYKRLGDVCKILNGYAFKSNHYIDNGGLRIIRIANVQDGYVCDNAPKFYPLDYVSSISNYILNEGDLLMSLTGNVGRVGILPKKFLPAALNQRVACLRPIKGLLVNYLFYTLNNKYFIQDAINSSTGIAQLNMSTDWLKDYAVPVPQIEVQQQIVSELDKINEIIEDCRELLRNLDALAQSLFYDYFGDPVANLKGWKIKKFSEVLKLSSGDGLSAKDITPGKYPVYGGNGIVGYHCTYNIQGQNIIIGRVGALCGNVRLVTDKAFITDNAFITFLKESLNLIYTTHLLTIINLHQYAKAVAQPVISNSSLKDIMIILPPLELQEKFAARIEQIEEQKKSVEQTIATLQTLLASRMDYWFND